MRIVLKFILVAILVVAFSLTSCSTKRIVEYRDRDVNHYITNTIHDTLINQTFDSVYFEVKVKGDTVFATKYKEKIRWRDRIVERHDTCWKDSIVTHDREIVKEITKIPKIYKVSLWISILIIIFAFVKLYRWLRTL